MNATPRQHWIALLVVLVLPAACGDIDVDLVTAPANPAAAGAPGSVECASDDDCTLGDETLCHPTEQRCVECVSDGHCEDPGEICSARLGECATPCNTPSDCYADDPLCDTVLGFCVECISDEDCVRPGALCRRSECAL